MTEVTEAKDAPPPRFARDTWTTKVPRPIHFILSILTLGFWRVIWTQPARLWIPAAIAGATQFLAFAGFDIWPLAWVSLVPLFWVLTQIETGKQAFWYGAFAGWVTNTGGFYWIAGLLMDFGHLPAAVAVPLMVGLAGIQGMVFGVASRFVFAVTRRWPSVPFVLIAPAAFVFAEMIFPMIFPWYIANSQYLFLPIIQSAEIWGPLGVSAMVVLINAVIFDGYRLYRDRAEGALDRLRLGAVVAGLVLFVANIGYGVVRLGQVQEDMANAETLKIGLVEANIGIWEKEAPDKIANNLVIHQNLSKRLADEGAELIVWPESAYQARYSFASTESVEQGLDLAKADVRRYPRYMPQNSTYLPPSKAPLVKDVSEDEIKKTPLEDRYTPQRGFSVPLLFGGITFRRLTDEEMKTDPPNKKRKVMVNGKIERRPRRIRVYNSAILLDEEGRVGGIYNKNYLLVFGEYIPGGSSLVYDLIPEASEFTPGTDVKVFDFKGHKLGVMICYEDIIPAFGRRLSALEPEVIINITNDAWFGKTHEPYLHLALATFRAVESRKWLLRATNTGVSAFIDATGEIRRASSLEGEETLLEDVSLLKGSGGPYTSLGDFAGYLAGVLFIGLWVVARRRPGNTSSPEPAEHDSDEEKSEEQAA